MAHHAQSSALLTTPRAMVRQAVAADTIVPAGERLRVGMVVNNLDVGGLEKVVISLIRRMQHAGHDPHLICVNGAGKMFDEVAIDSAKVLVHEKRQVPVFGLSIDPTLAMAIRRFAGERRLHVLHAHNLAPLVYAGIASRLFLRRRPAVVYSEHNQIYSASPTVRKRFSYYVRLADRVVAVSHDLKRELAERGHTSDHVEVIHNGVPDVQVPAFARADARAEMLAGPDTLLFGTVAVLSKQKGITYLLDAARTVIERIPQARFVIAGDGPLRQSLMQQAVQQGLGEHVRFIGYRQDVPRLMAGFDIYVQPSLWEGLPLVLLEALRAGRPIVATRVGGNPEAVIDGQNGVLVEPADVIALADALIRVGQDEQFRAAAAQRNAERFERRFALDAMVAAHLQLYTNLAAARPQG
jgi:glycosyltransferase involved in cell wall biosynthesis